MVAAACTAAARCRRAAWPKRQEAGGPGEHREPTPPRRRPPPVACPPVSQPPPSGPAGSGTAAPAPARRRAVTARAPPPGPPSPSAPGAPQSQPQPARQRGSPPEPASPPPEGRRRAALRSSAAASSSAGWTLGCGRERIGREGCCRLLGIAGLGDVVGKRELRGVRAGARAPFRSAWKSFWTSAGVICEGQGRGGGQSLAKDPVDRAMSTHNLLRAEHVQARTAGRRVPRHCRRAARHAHHGACRAAGGEDSHRQLRLRDLLVGGNVILRRHGEGECAPHLLSPPRLKEVRASVRFWSRKVLLHRSPALAFVRPPTPPQQAQRPSQRPHSAVRRPARGVEAGSPNNNCLSPAKSLASPGQLTGAISHPRALGPCCAAFSCMRA